jgi:hypothetical protein
MLYNEKIGELTQDNLIANLDVKQVVQSISIPSGTLKRGTVVDATGKALTTGLVPHCILCDDVDASAGAVVAEVYVAGCFNKNALITAGDYALTAENIKALRDGGIFVENAVK